MRKKLKEIGNDERHIFTGTFSRFGTKNGYKGIEHTVLLLDVKTENGETVCDHLWFNLTKGFERLNLKEGQKVTFSARVSKYEKGYKGYRDDVFVPIETDYKLSFPTQIYIIE